MLLSYGELKVWRMNWFMLQVQELSQRNLSLCTLCYLPNLTLIYLVFQAVIFSSEDIGRDLPGVEALLRKHDDLERDLTVIEGKMEVLESEAHRLARSQAHMVPAIQSKQTEIIESWERLNDLFDER